MQVKKKVCNVNEPARKHPQNNVNNNNISKLHPHDDVVTPTATRSRILPTAAVSVPARPPKPVDEDLYKIPPELLHSSKRVCNQLLFFFFEFLFIGVIIIFNSVP